MVAGDLKASRPVMTWAKLISPLAYGLAFILIIALNFLALFGIGYLVELVWPGSDAQSGYGLGDIAFLAGILLTSILSFGVLFGGLGWLLLWWEQVSRPKLVDHLRRCVFLYAAMLLLGSLVFYLLFLLPPPPEGDAPGGFFAILAFLCLAYSIALDAGLLLLKRRRSARTDSGGTI